ncbi:hypothetical protein BGZ63DRAFT_490965 [Mariannaea sp. PMI_226]|nr:hypothetical protein BGZ63DRAFT_490965 [Mariannaea sp. PMI_226]
MTSAAGGNTLAATACEYCRQKKKRCTKELPKCANCRPWPGPCIYSRATAHKPPLPSRVLHSELNQPSYSVLSPATNNSPELEGSKVQKPGEDSGSRSPHGSGCSDDIQTQIHHSGAWQIDETKLSSTSSTKSPTTQATERSANSAYAFMSALPLRDIPENNSRSISQEAMKGLLKSFTNTNVNEIDGSPNRIGDLFYIPGKQTAAGLASEVCNVLGSGDFMFLIPPLQKIERALLNPTGTEPRGLVLMANHILHSMSTSLDADSKTTKALFWNVQVALNDSALFLTPCEENLQALFTLAVHGEDRFSCPNLSWMLVGQATQQAKAIELHLPGSGVESSYQRRLSLFWALFVVDKTVSLAFGRPEFLDMAHYENVPLPSADHLRRFNPHTANSQVSASSNGFGPYFFQSNIAFAKYISRYSSTVRAGSMAEAQSYRKDLEIWFDQTIAELELRMKCELDHSDASIKEMELGIRTFKFQFFHLMILLLRDLDSHEDAACSMSRIALSMLSGLVSDSSGVYNGVVWQLLYYPFTPFFVLFRRILTSAKPSQDKEDLHHMQKMLAYYLDISHTIGPLRQLASKLGETARVFCKLVEQISQSEEKTRRVEQKEALDRFLHSYPAIRAESMNAGLHPTTPASHPEEQCELDSMQLDTDVAIDWFLWESHDVPIFPFV